MTVTADQEIRVRALAAACALGGPYDTAALAAAGDELALILRAADRFAAWITTGVDSGEEGIPTTAVHELAGAWGDGALPYASGVACACGVFYDGFDTIAQATELLEQHITNAQEREARRAGQPAAGVLDQLGERLVVAVDQTSVGCYACGVERPPRGGAGQGCALLLLLPLAGVVLTLLTAATR